MDAAAPATRSRFRLRDVPAASPSPAVAILPAGGEVWEDFLDTIDLPLEQFCAEGPGGWILGYMQALAQIGLRSALIFISARVSEPVRYCDETTGATISVLPVSRLYAALRRWLPRYRRPAAWRNGEKPTLWASLVAQLSTPISAMGRELAAQRCCAIICQEYEYFRFEAAAALGRRLRLPVFATFQGAAKEENRISRLLKRRNVRSAAGLLIASETEAERVRGRYGRDVRIFRVFNPVDLVLWNGSGRGDARAALGAGANTRIAVWHGRIAIYAKGLDILLEAWAEVRRARPDRDLRLMLLGNGEDAPEFRARIAELAEASIVWTDRYQTDPAVIREFLAAGDVFAFPSRLEGFAVAPLEAMACGVPVVAADASGVREIFEQGPEHGGLVAPRGDARAFAAALGRVLDDPAWSAELGRRARRRIEEAFSPQAVGRQLQAALSPEAA